MQDQKDSSAKSPKVHESTLAKPSHSSVKEQRVTVQHKVYTVEHEKEKLLFIPAYCALLFKKISHLDLREGHVKINCTLILRIPTSDVNPAVLGHIRERLEFRLCEEVISLQKGVTEGLTFSEKGDLMVFTYRFVKEIPVDVELRKTPFDQFDIPIDLEMTSTYVSQGDQGQIKYRFNLHENKNRQKTMSFKDDVDALAQFDILQKECRTNLISERKQKDKNTIYSYYPKVTFRVSIIRNPWHILLTIIFPVIVLELLSLAIFLQANDIAAKIANIATILLALLAYFPTIRSEVPSYPYLTFSDVFIYSSVLISACVLLEAVVLHKADHMAVTWVMFAITALIFVGNALALSQELIKHSFKRQGLAASFDKVKEASTGFDHKDWNNSYLEDLAFDIDAKVDILSTKI